ncbi:MAG: hypothetical protein H0X46_02205 [Bacteroidetes bacterium]|nr:hypothetical protein [Bacteroidota bacterium]
MKRYLSLIAGCLLTTGAMAQESQKKQDPVKEEKYCAVLKDGQMTLMHESVPVTSEITLNDGGKVTPAGIVVRKSGNVVAMVNGDCIDKEGNITNVNVPETPIKDQR